MRIFLAEEHSASVNRQQASWHSAAQSSAQRKHKGIPNKAVEAI
jgi:hypothetical protein